MAFLEFEEKHILGLPEIDDQHKKIYATVNHLYAIRDHASEEILASFADLIEQLKVHFSCEEGVMTERKVIHCISHKLEHDRAFKKYSEYYEKVESGEEKFSPEILDSLKNWLEAHFEKKDSKLKELAKLN